MNKGKNVFWGLLFLLGAIAVLAGRMGVFEGIGFWSVLVSIGLAGVLIDGIIKRSWGMILFSLAFLAIVNGNVLGIEKLVPGPVLGAALLGTIGLSMLFPMKHRHGNHLYRLNGYKQTGEEEYQETVDSDGAEQVNCDVSFKSAAKYIQCTQLKKARLESSFGNLAVYFDNAMLRNHEAVVELEVSFGNMELYIPAGWQVICNVSTSFGHVEEQGQRGMRNGEDVLTIQGDVSFGTLEIHHI